MTAGRRSIFFLGQKLLPQNFLDSRNDKADQHALIGFGFIWLPDLDSNQGPKD